MTRAGVSVRKMALTTMLAVLSFVLSTFVIFPLWRPSSISATFWGRVPGPLVRLAAAAPDRPADGAHGADHPGSGGRHLRRVSLRPSVSRKRASCGWGIGEVLGTGILSAIVAYPLMRLVLRHGRPSPLLLHPLLPSARRGRLMGCAVILLSSAPGLWNRMLNQLNR